MNIKNNSLLFEEYLKIKQEETELLKTIPPNLKPYYKNKVNEYIKSIENIMISTAEPIIKKLFFLLSLKVYSL